MPIVSVLFPIYNAAKDLPNAVNSLLRQTFTDFEVIAIDDGSTDGSGELLDKYSREDTRIRVIHQENAGALGIVLNRAAALAQGKYLARQDADDLSDVSRFLKQVEYLDKHQNTGLCGSWAWYIDASLGPLFSLEVPDNHTLLNGYLNKGMNPFVHGSVMMRADIFQKLGGYRGSYSEDYDLWLRMGEVSQLGMCTALGYYYWRSVGGISAGANLRQQKLTQLVLKLRAERLQHGHEITNWQDEYRKILNLSTDESNPVERQTLLHYSRGLQLLYRQRFVDAREELARAAAGQGIYAAKARRNLSLFIFAPLLSIFYTFLQRQEPFRFARKLPANTHLPSF